MRFCLNIIGPFESILIAIIIVKITGDSTANKSIENNISSILFTTQYKYNHALLIFSDNTYISSYTDYLISLTSIFSIVQYDSIYILSWFPFPLGSFSTKNSAKNVFFVFFSCFNFVLPLIPEI